MITLILFFILIICRNSENFVEEFEDEVKTDEVTQDVQVKSRRED